MAFATQIYFFFTNSCRLTKPHIMTMIFESAKFANCTGFIKILKFAPFENYHLYGTRNFFAAAERLYILDY